MRSSTNGWDGSPESSRPRSLGPAQLAVGTDLLLAAILTVFLFAATERHADVVPRPLVVGVLFAVPGFIGLLGIVGRRRSLIGAAGLALFPGSVMAFSLVTLPFVIPAILFAATAFGMPDRHRDGLDRLVGLGRMVLIGGLVIAAGWAALIGLTVEACYTIPAGSGCGTGQLSWAGVVTAGVLLTAGIAISAWTIRGRLRTQGRNI